jgi:hypothetical protein
MWEMFEAVWARGLEPALVSDFESTPLKAAVISFLCRIIVLHK